MDEEDGRLGPRARQPGRVDVLTDALTKSLCSSLAGVRTGSKKNRTHIRMKENCDENVSGK